MVIASGHQLNTKEENKLKRYAVKIIILGLLMLLLLATPLIGACASPAPATEAIKWDAIGGWTRGNDWIEMQYIPMIEAINKAAKGRLVINWAGGPEAVSPVKQMKPLGENVYQMLYTSSAYHAADVPAATINNCLVASPKELRAAGFYDAMENMYAKKANVKFLMNGPYGSGFGIYLNKPVDKADFTGLRLRATGFYKPLVEGLGGSTVGMPAGDIYLAMQQNTVDGFAWPVTSFLSYKWEEVTKYMIKPTFGEYCGSLYANLDAWNALPKDLQDTVSKVVMERESADRKQFMKTAAEEIKGMVAGGMEIIELPPAEAAKFLNVFWDKSIPAFSGSDPEFGPQLKAAIDKLGPSARGK